ncbi:hypothetical protein EON63_15730 [archaeon]|nr:MAG: hypothetical protein EON63_15730 [archaeon]
MEHLIMRHQADNLKLADQLSEATLKHNQKTALLARDVSPNTCFHLCHTRTSHTYYASHHTPYILYHTTYST